MTVKRRRRNPKRTRSTRTAWGGRHFTRLKWTGWLFGSRRHWKHR